MERFLNRFRLKINIKNAFEHVLEDRNGLGQFWKRFWTYSAADSVAQNRFWHQKLSKNVFGQVSRNRNSLGQFFSISGNVFGHILLFWISFCDKFCYPEPFLTIKNTPKLSKKVFGHISRDRNSLEQFLFINFAHFIVQKRFSSQNSTNHPLSCFDK